MFTGRQPYCERLCPFGELQKLSLGLKGRPPQPRGWFERLLVSLPGALLLVVVFTGFGVLDTDLVALEPFDAFVFWLAGTGTLTVAGVGLFGSLLAPKAYCRFGCPTGAALEFVRTGRNARWRLADTVAVVVLAIGASLWLWR